MLLSACSFFDKNDPKSGWSAERLYKEAKEALDGGQYDLAIKHYETLEARFPYGRYAQQAQLEIAYAYYKQNEQASAVAAADRYVKLHPNSANVDYAYYLKGLAFFNEDLGLFGKVARQDRTERDPKSARDSFDAFKDLAQRFPDSKYTPDALARMKFLVNALASHEMHVARYYMKRGAYVAAANRAQFALKNYPQAPAVRDALQVLVEAYDALGMPDLRNDADRVLRMNFPDAGTDARTVSPPDGQPGPPP